MSGFVFNNRDVSALQCYNNACKSIVDEAKAKGRTTNYGCVGHFPLDEPLPWTNYPDTSDPDMVYVTGRCSCDNALINTIADTIIEALPIIALIGCYLVMSMIKLVLDIGLQAIPGVGKILDAGLDAVTSAAQLLAYAYPEDQDPAGAFECTVADGVSSFKTPKFKKGSGRKGDDANPTDRAKPKKGTGSGPNGTGSSGVQKRRRCNVPPGKTSTMMGEAVNTLRVQSCVAAAGGGSTTTKVDYVITSIHFGPQPTTVSKVCSEKWSQACYHYSSAIVQQPAWKVLPRVHGNVKNPSTKRPGVEAWYDQHDRSWLQKADRQEDSCNADEFPPRYLLSDSDPEIISAGKTGGQLMRYIPFDSNQDAGRMWKGACFVPHIAPLTTPARFEKEWAAGKNKNTASKNGVTKYQAEIDVNVKPYFEISFKHAAHPPANEGMYDNKCWPKGKAANDPGFALFSWDNWYSNPSHPHLYDYTQAYEKGKNGA